MHIDFALPVAHHLLAGWEEWQKKAEVRLGGWAGVGRGGGRGRAFLLPSTC